MTTPDPNLKETISQMMRRVRQQAQMPGSDRIVKEAFQELNYDSSHVTPADARLRFNEVLSFAFAHTLTVLERYENKAYSEGIAQALLELRSELVDQADAINAEQGFEPAAKALLAGLYLELRESFLSVSQSRKTRGGKDFELSFAQTLTLAGFTYQMQEIKTRADFILPSNSAFQQNRTLCAVASLKRTLRERWTEVAAELVMLHMPNVFLVTADHDVKPGTVKGICDDNPLHLVVWDAVKEKQYKDHPRVLSFTQFANERLPNLQSMWASAGLV